ncbi:MAG: competence protein CoiA family protein [Patescibacteria group bacterium]
MSAHLSNDNSGIFLPFYSCGKITHNLQMLSAKRKSNGQVVLANSESRSNAPFLCLECDAEVVLRTGSVRVNYFAHHSRSECPYATGESESHRNCKMEIYHALLRAPGVTDVALERSFGTNRADVFARINSVPVAIEVQISVLSIETIIRRTEEYARKGIFVLWLPQWTPYLDGVRYSPRLWEKWVHAAYFGRVYYWLEGAKVAEYRFEPYLQRIGTFSFRNGNGKSPQKAAYSRPSKRYRQPTSGRELNLASNFKGIIRSRWRSKHFVVPEAKIFIQC